MLKSVFLVNITFLFFAFFLNNLLPSTVKPSSKTHTVCVRCTWELLKACLQLWTVFTLFLSHIFLLSLSQSHFSWLYCYQRQSEMFLLLMHTNAQPLTGADSMKREAAEINTYVMRERGSPNGLPICFCQRLRQGCIDI